MRPGGGKSKGASFEREVCVLLSKWLSNGTQEDIFWRSALSGGRATVAFKRGKRLASQVGDISCIHPIGNHFISSFAPECKNYANLDWQGLLTGKGKLLQFWNEIKNQASRYDKHPFLIARQNRMRSVVCLDSTGLNKLNILRRKAILISPPNGMFIFDFETFLKVCQPYKLPC